MEPRPLATPAPNDTNLSENDKCNLSSCDKTKLPSSLDLPPRGSELQQSVPCTTNRRSNFGNAVEPGAMVPLAVPGRSGMTQDNSVFVMRDGIGAAPTAVPGNPGRHIVRTATVRPTPGRIALAADFADGH
jgi:hypothetical protein